MMRNLFLKSLFLVSIFAAFSVHVSAQEKHNFTFETSSITKHLEFEVSDTVSYYGNQPFIDVKVLIGYRTDLRNIFVAETTCPSFGSSVCSECTFETQIYAGFENYTINMQLKENASYFIQHPATGRNFFMLRIPIKRYDGKCLSAWKIYVDAVFQADKKSGELTLTETASSEVSP